MTTLRKTNRRYGRVFTAVRQRIASIQNSPRPASAGRGQGEGFTKYDFSPLHPAQAIHALSALRARGELSILQPGRPGRKPRPAVFKSAIRNPQSAIVS